VKNLYGEAYGLSVVCTPHEFTRVTLRLPVEGGTST
jgi:LytS/YehU family sensor histidine kinase